ncbi:hypothetical protein ASF64_01085 [Arthrobacter sp. Leaf137]|nr:hypothetical protein ASF64_01085 [Arthrobacter sp. Leaf137]
MFLHGLSAHHRATELMLEYTRQVLPNQRFQHPNSPFCDISRSYRAGLNGADMPFEGAFHA